MKQNAYYIIKSPVITEESTIQTEAKGHYVFRVDPRANKNQIREAVEEMYDVRVMSVNTMNYLGKMGRRVRGGAGRRPNWKKAVVKLHPEDSIELM
ncbi:MAG: 50S ribosomal protein L23 [Candidatus Hydrogenedentota bacterium]